MAGVYTKRLFRVAGGSNGPTLAYTVPGGTVTVVRCIAISFGANLLGANAWVQDGTLAKLVRFGQGGGAGPFTGLGNGRWALVAGDTLSWQTDGAVCDFYVTGYEFAA